MVGVTTSRSLGSHDGSGLPPEPGVCVASLSLSSPPDPSDRVGGVGGRMGGLLGRLEASPSCRTLPKFIRSVFPLMLVICISRLASAVLLGYNEVVPTKPSKYPPPRTSAHSSSSKTKSPSTSYIRAFTWTLSLSVPVSCSLSLDRVVLPFGLCLDPHPLCAAPLHPRAILSYSSLLVLAVMYTSSSDEASSLAVVVLGVMGALSAAGALSAQSGALSCAPGALLAASALIEVAASLSAGASANMWVSIAGFGQLNILRMGGARFVRAM
ncbi:unnamed protein product [Rhizoctonia solani]|uniref:Uncharacterized protein n=1 Tax=Rhizoctonia solani TaxID=456999 RepID=A0A8H3BBT5_9AGAM|nr:unnamed protein product [Rhizoctonia solani]